MSTTIVKERPILFSPQMVRALRAGLKTQTRRVAKALPNHPAVKAWSCVNDWFQAEPVSESVQQQYITTFPFGWYRCPYGVPGDRLVSLCTWASEKRFDRRKPSSLPRNARVWTYFDDDEKPDWCGRSRPGRFMPGWMRARMPRGEIVSVRAERAWEISEADAVAEGFAPIICEEVFALAARGVREEPLCYITRECDGADMQLEWCPTCADKEARKLKRKTKQEHRVSRDHGEKDGPAWCATCHVLLERSSLTDYGIERELFFESNSPEDLQRFAASGSVAAIARDFARSVPEKYRGRLAQIGFATTLDLVNGRGAWARNDWYWAITFKTLENA